MTKRFSSSMMRPNIVISLEFPDEKRVRCCRRHVTAEALARWPAFAPDLVLLDVMMPKKSGFEVCRSPCVPIPAQPACSIVMLTAKGRETEVAKGLAIGADAYVTKPFRPRIW